ncbi:putative NODULIN-LIKE PROTEIN [Salix koriyanagi]|uniref:NODULIN-LIKE PROTEIN n=1 Tax=Salix koriyanagi TaxID=2511006 RepID=A0A9Q0W0A2_9ROSI|nr:putative NODULIN-LIKE PROTEIN [Salix koriyanagi]
MSALFVRDVNARTGNNMKVGFVAMFVLTIATGIYAVVSSFGSVSSRLPPLGNAIGISVFLLAPLAIPMAEKMKEKFLNGEMKVYIEENVGDHVERIESGIKAEDDQTREDDGVCVEEIGAMVMLKRVNFWLYFFVYLSGATLGLVYLNNLGQIAESRGNSGTSSLVSLSSSFGFFGRLMPSLLEFNSSRSRYMKSRPACIAALMAPMAGAFFLLLSTANISLYISTAIIGVCTGAITSISVSTTTELFGTKNFSVNHNVVVANIPVGSFIFGYSAALFYRREASEDGKCMGMECYRNTFIIWGSLCLLGTFLALVLHARLRKFYSHT